MLVSSQFKDDSFLMSQEKTLYEHIMEISTEPALFTANSYIPFQLHVPSYTCGLIAGENWYEPRIITTTTFPDSDEPDSPTPEEPDEPVIGDILDNEWPIEWKLSEVINNPQFIADGLTYRKISDVAIDTDWENVAVELTVKMETDVTIQCIQTDSNTDMAMYVAVTEDIFFSIALAYVEAGENEGVIVPETGLYYIIIDGNTGTEPNAEYDIKMKLTK